MIGIVSYGGYVPRVRLDRMSIMKSMGWFAPNLFGIAKGERSMCNWDEDSLTMAVAAGQDCLSGMDKANVDALYMASTTFPFLDRQNAGVLKLALNLRDDISSADFASSLRAGTTAIVAGVDAIKGGDKKQVMVVGNGPAQGEVGFKPGNVFRRRGCIGVIGEGKCNSRVPGLLFHIS